MTIARIAGATALALLAVGQVKAEVTGGELRFGHERFLDEIATPSGDDTATRTSIEGALEVGLAPGASVQLDLGLDRAGIFDDTGTNATLHGLYRFGPGARGGLFAGLDSLGDTDVSFYGLEGGLDLDRVSLEGYLMATDGEAEGTVAGLRGAYLATADWILGGRIERGAFDGDVEAARYGVSADYELRPGTTLSAELGHAETTLAGVGSASDQYLGLQATFSFGAEDGVAFGRRGLLDLLPGF